MREFTVHAAPQGQERPRFGAHAYTPAKTREYEELVQWEYRAQVKDAPYPARTPLTVKIEAVYPVPMSDSVRIRQAKLCGLLQPCKKPDTDNIAKAVLDALNGVAYNDDAQVVRLLVVKSYGTTGHVNIQIEEAV